MEEESWRKKPGKNQKQIERDIKRSEEKIPKLENINAVSGNDSTEIMAISGDDEDQANTRNALIDRNIKKNSSKLSRITKFVRRLMLGDLIAKQKS